MQEMATGSLKRESFLEEEVFPAQTSQMAGMPTPLVLLSVGSGIILGKRRVLVMEDALST